MYIIEPCCAKRHLGILRDNIKNGGTAEFTGYGDLSLTELLPALLTSYGETKMMIVAPSIPDQAAESIARWMRQQWARADGRGKLDVIRHMTIVADLSENKSPVASQWLNENPWGDRLTIIDHAQEETAILLPDFAITGPVNLRYGRNFTAEATTDPERIKALWEKFLGLAKEPEKKEGKADEPAKEEPAGEKPAGKDPEEPKEPAAPARKHKAGIK